ncbi:MAG: AbrB/MazE/SpoVT family DNA-binding domain-containing protein [Pseudonocardia sp.]|nr:AbrB/MazE/SpoVT family DNA-binding domain-containing protein [Pseudonocardia sp.]
METTIDSGGRVVVPKAFRERLGLAAGTRVEISEGDGVITIARARVETRLEERDGVLVAVTDLPVDARVDAEATRDVLEAVRERRA